MIQLSSLVFFILKSAAQTYSQYSTSEISTVVGGYQTPFVDGKTEARAAGAQDQPQPTGPQPGSRVGTPRLLPGRNGAAFRQFHHTALQYFGSVWKRSAQSALCRC